MYLQSGGNDSNENSLTAPYKYFDYIFRNNPLTYIYNRINTSKKINSTQHPEQIPSQTNNILNSLGFKKKEENDKVPYSYHSDPVNVPTLLSINPTVKKPINGSIVQNTKVFDTIPEDVKEKSDELSEVDTKSDSETGSSPQQNVEQTVSNIVIRFTPNIEIVSLKKLFEERNPDIDIDINSSKFKYKELEKLKVIKEKKQLPYIYIEEIYYINGKLIVLKGIYNEPDTSTDINLESELSIYENTRGNIV